MGQALYRKYRPRTLDEIVGQKPITTALKNALKSGNISHAYLFTGPRGTGKTSIARILAFEINKIKYNSNILPLDIIEIDAASNRRIDEIRDLREKVRIAPISAKYKVYIIDEVHMLTREAFNALLKTLEEPPAHVIFVLATTESHKLPETIVSRTQRYSFQLATIDEVSEHLKAVAAKENIKIDDEAINLLAKHSGGSMRDALSLLDQVRHSTVDITSEIVRLNLGLPSENIVKSILEAIKSGMPNNIIVALESAKSNGATPSLIAEELIASLRGQILDNPSQQIETTLNLTQALLMVESSSRPEVQLELALIGAQLNHIQPNHTITSAARISAPKPPLTIAKPLARNQPTKHIKTTEDKSVNTISTNIIAPNTSGLTFSDDNWNATLETLRKDHNTLYSILRMAKPQISDTDETQIRLLFKFAFHQRRMNEAHNKQHILSALELNGITGYEIVCDILPKNSSSQEVDKPNTPTPEQVTPQVENGALSQIRNVFGGAEVLE